MSNANPSDYWNAMALVKKTFETKLCLAQHQSPYACEGQIIRAHTVPRSQLRRIDVEGHVYAVEVNAADVARTKGAYPTRKVGINQFSVFNCFCAKHDQVLFTHLENDALIFDSHQLTLLHYRAIASELYRKLMAYCILDQRIKNPTENERANLHGLQEAAYGQCLGIQDVGIAFDRCSAALAAKRFDEICGLVVYFKRMPSVMTAGSFTPQYSYDGAPLNQLHDDKAISESISFSILVADARATVSMVWFKEQKMLQQFAESFIQPQTHCTTRAIQTAFEYLETTCMEPTWWESLKKVEQELLLTRMRCGIEPQVHKPNCLAFGGVTFDEWEYDRHILLNV
jgi:hypothetical protein